MEFIASKPVLDAGAEWYRDAYARLSTDRTPTMAGIGPIRWSAIDAYAQRHGLDRDASARLVDVIQRVDAETLRRAALRARQSRP